MLKKLDIGTSRDLLFVIIFLAVLTLNFWVPVVGIQDYENTENRQLTSLPTLIIGEEFDSYAAQFVNYFNDHFSLRYRVLSMSRKLLTQIFDHHYLSNVVIGNNDWLFVNLEINTSPCQQFPAIPQSILNDHLTVLSKAQERLEAQNVRLYFTIAPNKCTIYPEYASSHLPVLGEQPWIDQYYNFLRAENNKLQFLELRPDLVAAKDDYQVYLQTDTHWTAYGIYTAYRTIAQNLLVELPDDELLAIDDLNQKEVFNYQGDLSLFLRLPDRYNEEIIRFSYNGEYLVERLENRTIVYENLFPPNDLILVVYNDSFFGRNTIKELLAAHFKTVIFFTRNFNLIWDPSPVALDTLIDQWDPDIILVERSERSFLEFAGD